jgi:hypothetical protein
MIDTDKIDNMKQWTNDYKVRMFWDLVREVKRLASRLRDAEDLLENCGYCRECFWDKESISDVAAQLTEPVWPNDCTPLCESCMVDFKDMIE